MAIKPTQSKDISTYLDEERASTTFRFAVPASICPMCWWPCKKATLAPCEPLVRLHVI